MMRILSSIPPLIRRLASFEFRHSFRQRRVCLIELNHLQRQFLNLCQELGLHAAQADALLF